jgi:hypothetical protein
MTIQLSRRDFFSSITGGLIAITGPNPDTEIIDCLVIDEHCTYNFPKPKDYWKDWENVEREYKTHVGNEEMPTMNKLSHEHPSLAKAISTYHGGFAEVRKKLE